MSPERRTAAVVYNPIKIDLDAVREVVGREEKAAGWNETQWFETSKEDPGQGATARALDAGADLVIAAGGDGTVRAVAERLVDSDAALALLPSGTGNLLARNLKLTLDDLEHSLHAAFAGEDRPIDYGRVEIRHPDGDVSKHVYVVMVGVGVDAEMLAATDADLKKKVGWLAYASALVKVLKKRNRLKVRYQVDDGETRSVGANTVIAGNCGLLAGNILLLPDAAIDDGMLDVVIVSPESFAGWLQILVTVFWENGVVSRLPFVKRREEKKDALNYKQAARLTVKLNNPQHVEIDGDEYGEATALRTWIEPRGLTVRVPRD